VLINESLLS